MRLQGIPAIDRFWMKVQKSDNCWHWTGGKKKAGYGQFLVGDKKKIAHRFSYEQFVGEIPEGFEIDHLCRNKSCVNPEHLEAVTLKENRRRRVEAKTHCNSGHLYDEANTMYWTDRDGYINRYCRTCRRAR